MTDELVAWISDQLRTRRVPLKFVAGAVGLTPSTLARWMKQGEEDATNGHLSRAAVLWIEVQRAQFEFAATTMHDLQNAPPKEWVKFAWILERCFQDTFAIQKKEKDVNNPLELLGELFAARIASGLPTPQVIDVEPEVTTADSSAVEPGTENPGVGGSNPSLPANDGG